MHQDGKGPCPDAAPKAVDRGAAARARAKTTWPARAWPSSQPVRPGSNPGGPMPAEGELGGGAQPELAQAELPTLAAHQAADTDAAAGDPQAADAPVALEDLEVVAEGRAARAAV